ncbi:MAG: helix-turn-helix transcriptional regulator [Planctomycetaceae bacterium]
MLAPSIQDICKEAGVTATAVRQRLNRLLSSGYIERKSVRMGRGRPHHTYHVTPEGKRVLGEDYSILANVLWQELFKIPDEKLKQQVLNRVRDGMAIQLGKGVESDDLQNRLKELQARLQQQGFDVEATSINGLPVLREYSCPYYDLANADPQVCELERQVYEKVLGVSLYIKERCVDGHSCCEFVVREDETPASTKDPASPPDPQISTE